MDEIENDDIGQDAFVCSNPRERSLVCCLRKNARPLCIQIRKALILPGFCHDGELKTSGRKPDEYYVTGPVEVAIQPFIATGNFPNGTWFNGTVRCVCVCRCVCGCVCG